MVTSVKLEKMFDQIWPSFMVKTLNKTHRRNISQHNKGHLWQTHIWYYSQYWKLKTFPLKSEARQRGLLLPFLLNTVLEVQSTAIRQKKKKKERKVIQIGSEEIKFTINRWHNIIGLTRKTVCFSFSVRWL